jgi:hypothetical protein
MSSSINAIAEVQNAAFNFLYVFIASDAPLNQVIMAKRNNQVKVLSAMATQYHVSYTDLKQAVFTGIVAQTGGTPAQVLATIYSNAIKTKNAVSAVDWAVPYGSSSSDYYATDSNGNGVPDYLEVVQETNGKKWDWAAIINVIQEIFVVIAGILTSLGITKKHVQPYPQDWINPSSQSMLSANILSYMPYIALGGVILVVALRD